MNFNDATELAYKNGLTVKITRNSGKNVMNLTLK